MYETNYSYCSVGTFVFIINTQFRILCVKRELREIGWHGMDWIALDWSGSG
jgi:hypothetical protein